MKVTKRLCLKDYEIVDEERKLSFTIKRGQEYTTTLSADADGDVTVFSKYWAHAPRDIFEPDESGTECLACAKMKAAGLNPNVLANAYGWTYDIDGQIHGLVAGDQGFEGTGIVVNDIFKFPPDAEDIERWRKARATK